VKLGVSGREICVKGVPASGGHLERFITRRQESRFCDLLAEEVNRRSPFDFAQGQALHYAPPDFLSRLVALSKFLRLSLTKAAYADLVDFAKQEIRVRSGPNEQTAWAGFASSLVGPSFGV
jgi:hypothetical protein